MRQIYLETIYGGLVLCKHVKRIDSTLVRAIIAKSGHGYRKDEIIEYSSFHFVHKAGFRNGFQYVSPVEFRR